MNDVMDRRLERLERTLEAMLAECPKSGCSRFTPCESCYWAMEATGQFRRALRLLKGEEVPG